MMPPRLPCPGEAIVDGDALSVSIAAASIIAKVTRDRLMGCLGRAFPGYGFESHMGYSTPGHFAALKRSKLPSLDALSMVSFAVPRKLVSCMVFSCLWVK